MIEMYTIIPNLPGFDNISEMPNKTVEVLLKFNKYSKIFVGFQLLTDEIRNNMVEVIGLEPQFEHVISKMNPVTETVIGNRSKFEIVKKVDQKPVVYEMSLDQLCYNKIQKHYPERLQCNNLRRALVAIVGALESNGIQLQTDEFSTKAIDELKNMDNTIEEIVKQNKLKKEKFSTNENYTYITYKDYDDLMVLLFSGAVHETHSEFGPRQVMMDGTGDYSNE